MSDDMKKKVKLTGVLLAGPTTILRSRSIAAEACRHLVAALDGCKAHEVALFLDKEVFWAAVCSAPGGSVEAATLSGLRRELHDLCNQRVKTLQKALKKYGCPP
jgi:hypothetical protein